MGSKPWWNPCRIECLSPEGIHIATYIWKNGASQSSRFRRERSHSLPEFSLRQWPEELCGPGHLRPSLWEEQAQAWDSSLWELAAWAAPCEGGVTQSLGDLTHTLVCPVGGTSAPMVLKVLDLIGKYECLTHIWFRGDFGLRLLSWCWNKIKTFGIAGMEQIYSASEKDMYFLGGWAEMEGWNSVVWMFALPNLYVEILIPKIIVLGVWVFDNWLGHKVRALMSMVNASQKRLQRDSLPLHMEHIAAPRYQVWTRKHAGAFILYFPAFRTVRRQFLLLISYPVCISWRS